MISVTPDNRRPPLSEVFPPFGSDLAARGNALEVRVVRSPYARAAVGAFDTAVARRQPGIEAVLTAADLPGVRVLTGDWAGLPVLADGEVVHYGQAIALVAALTTEAAGRALDALDIPYQPLPPVTGLEEAVALHAFHGDAVSVTRGEIGTAMESATRRLTHTFEMKGQEREFPEPGWAQAEPDGRGGLEIITPCAHSSALHAVLADVLRLPMSAIRLSAPAHSACPASDPLPTLHAALVAHACGRPAWIRQSPEEHRLLAPRRPGIRVLLDAGYDESGGIIAFDATLFVDAGCSPVGAEALLSGILQHLDGVYVFPNVRLSVRLCRSHFPPRGAGIGDLAARAQVVVEELIARVARSLGILPEIVRQRNLAVPQPEGESGSGPVSAGGVAVNPEAMIRLWRHTLKQSDFGVRRKEVDAWNARNPLVKRGLAAVPSKLGLGDARTGTARSAATVQIYPDGSVRVFSDADTAALRAEVVATVVEGLGARPESVQVVPGATGSGCPDLAVLAANDAASRLRGDLLPLIMRIFRENGATEVLPENLQFSPGRIADRLDPNLGFPFESLVAFVLVQGAGLSATGSAAVQHFGLPFFGYLYGTAVAEVEVDSFTGESRILRADLFHEAAVSSVEIDAAALGLRASFIEALGWMTSEIPSRISEGAITGGQHTTGALVPGLDEAPLDFRSEFLESADRTGDAAEGGHSLAISVREALRDAIGSFGGGVGAPLVDLPVPAPPEAIYRLIQQQRIAVASASTSA
jgi:xanthine dehydrogenase molybdopterin-binding subunit B